MDKAPRQNQFYYNPLTLPLLKCLPHFNPVTQQYMTKEETPRQDQDVSPESKPNSSPPPSYHSSNKVITDSTSSVDPIHEACGGNTDNRLNKDDSYVLCNSRNNEFVQLHAFDEHQKVNGSKEIEQFHESRQSQTFRHNQALFVESLKPEPHEFQQNHMTPNINETIVNGNTKEQGEKSDQLLRCDPCGKVFSKVCYLIQHTNARHGKQKLYRCKKCGKRYSTDSELRTHFLKHGNKKAHSCSICYKRFNYKIDLRRHLYLHRGMPYSCSICNKGYNRRDHLATHEIIHTKPKVKKKRKTQCNL